MATISIIFLMLLRFFFNWFLDIIFEMLVENWGKLYLNLKIGICMWGSRVILVRGHTGFVFVIIGSLISALELIQVAGALLYSFAPLAVGAWLCPVFPSGYAFTCLQAKYGREEQKFASLAQEFFFFSFCICNPIFMKNCLFVTRHLKWVYTANTY